MPGPSDPTVELTREQMLALIEIGRELSAEITLETLLKRILIKASELTDSPDTSVILCHEGAAADRGLYVAEATGEKASEFLATFGKHGTKSIPVSGSKAGLVFQSGTSIVENKVVGHFEGVDHETKNVTQSMVCVPLGVGRDAMGVMQILNKRSGIYTAQDRLLLEHFASHAAVAIKNAQLFESALGHSGFYARITETSRLFEIMRDLSRPARFENLTVFFADMRGFTQLCQSLGSAAEIQQQLNEFITMLAEEVIAHQGIVNKFLGDGLMALFRDTDHGEHAVRAAFRILERFDEMKARWNDASSEQLDFLDVGIGIVSGEVTLGAIGSEKIRDFTAIGTCVNLAAALENSARDGRRIIANHLTYSAVRTGVEADRLPDFELKKPNQTVGVRHKCYSLKRLIGPVQERLFISHSHQDREYVDAKIVKPLADLGVKTWYATTDVEAGDLWAAEIRCGLVESTCVLVVVSQHASNSKWVRREVDIALSTERLNNRIIPLRLDKTPPESVNEWLAGTQGIDVRMVDDVARALQNWIHATGTRPKAGV